MYYDILFAAVWNTLYSFGYSHYGSETGAVAVLHSWGQNMSLHPHIHCIVPAVGYTLEAEWKEIGHSGKYLYPVHQMSDTFKGKFLDSLKRALRKQNELVLFDEITNQRILNIENGKITFIAKDYRDRAIKKPVTLDGIEFLRRFTMHILPKRFVKIRRYGIYNHTVKRNMALHFTSEKKKQ